jgi:GNAT superfamily N-acetyltransferase
MPSLATLHALDAHWATLLGCRRADLHAAQTLVVAHGPGLAHYQGALALRHGPACILSVPAPLVARVAPAIQAWTPDQVFDRDALAGLFGVTSARIIGPAWQGYADAGDFRPADARGTLPLGPGDEDALRRLAEICGAIAWEHSALRIGQPETFGYVVDGELVAAGNLTPEGERYCAVGILTHPAHRGQGYARAIVSAMTAHGLAGGRVLRYQTLCANAPALAVARALGYAAYATTLAVRLDQGAAVTDQEA